MFLRFYSEFTKYFNQNCHGGNSHKKFSNMAVTSVQIHCGLNFYFIFLSSLSANESC